MVRETTTNIPNRTAVYYMGRGITFHELDIFSNQLAHFLMDCGLKPGDTVGVNLPNIPAYYISILAIQKAGCVLTGVSPLLPPKELEYQLTDSGAKLLVTLDALLDKAAAVVGRTQVKTLAVASVADFLSPVKRGLGKLFKKIPGGKIKPVSGVDVVRFSEVLRRMPSDRIEGKLDPAAACLMQYTGGTTGPPKGAVLTHRNIVSQLHQVSTWLDIQGRRGIHPDVRLSSVSPGRSFSGHDGVCHRRKPGGGSQSPGSEFPDFCAENLPTERGCQCAHNLSGAVEKAQVPRLGFFRR